MKLTWLLMLCLVVTAVTAKDRSKRKNRDRNNKRVERGRQDDPREVDSDDTDEEYETIDVTQEGGQPENLANPCNTHKCKRGEVCELNERKARCVCQTCDQQVEEENKLPVCSTKNVTYTSECHLDRDHCLCKSRDPACLDNRQDKVRLDYYHSCQELTECKSEEMEMFPVRMREWLLRVMTDLAMRGDEELDEYRDLLENARHDKQHADAVIWKFCDLDVHPNDRRVTRRELLYIIASLKHMEHCLVPFMNGCDADNDNNITLVEWGECLGIGHEAIVDKCKIKQ